jgi:hypothetical protein
VPRCHPPVVAPFITRAAPSCAGGAALNADSRSGALAAYQAFFDTFNARDAAAWAATLQFPHVRISHRGPADIVPNAASYIATTSWERIERTGWHHTTPLEPGILHEGENRVHIAGGWTRYTKDGQPILSSEVTYVVTLLDGHWGIQARFGVDPTPGVSADDGAITAAEGAPRRYLEYWNSKRFEDAAGLLNYPYVRVDPGNVTVWQSPPEHMAWLAAQPWRQIAVSDSRLVQVSALAANLTLSLAQSNTNTDCLLLVTCRDGRWGVQAESTF